MLAKTNTLTKQIKIANGLIANYPFCITFPYKNDTNQSNSSFWSRLSFIYAFPIKIINRNTQLIQKNGISPNTVYIQTQTKTYTQKLIINNQIFSLPNYPSFTTLHLSKALRFAKIKSDRQEKTLQTNKDESFSPTLNETRLPTLKNLQTQIILAPKKTLSTKQMRITSKTLHLFTHQLINPVNNTENSTTRTNENLPSKVPSQTTQQANLIQKTGPTPISFELASAEHLIKHPQPKIKDAIKQCDVELGRSKPSGDREKILAPDINSLANKVYQLIERKARIERERRG